MQLTFLRQTHCLLSGITLLFNTHLYIELTWVQLECGMFLQKSVSIPY